MFLLFLKSNWKLIAIGFGVLVLLYSFRLWLVKRDERIYQEGRVSATIELEKAKKAEWTAKEAEFAKAQQDIDLTRSQIDSEMSVLARTRNMTRVELEKALAAARAGREVRIETVAAIPATELDTALRSVSNELATK